MSNKYKFNGRIRKRISAEQFSDALSSILAPVFPDSLVAYNPFGKMTLVQAKQSFARASLVANNPFLTALGRPNREVVSTGRDSQANLLEALELTNGEKFTSVLAMGATRWIDTYPSNNLLVKELFKKALGREPNEQELSVAIQTIGNKPNRESIQDLFWSILLLPEFQIVY